MFSKSIILCGFVGLMAGSCSGSSAQEQYPARFFTTPEQRDAIDSIRYATESEISLHPLPEPDKNELEKKTTTKTELVNFKGYIKNPKGDAVYWVNNKNSMEHDFNKNNFDLQKVKSAAEILRLIVDDEKDIQLKAGESYLPAFSGDNSDLVSEGTIMRHH